VNNVAPFTLVAGYPARKVQDLEATSVEDQSRG
jgi:hypothetical protein